MNASDNNYGVSPRALSIARMIDRLEPGGTYIIELIRPQSNTERWLVTVTQPVTVRRMSLENKPPQGHDGENQP